MARNVKFPTRPDYSPKIYVFNDSNYPGTLKVGYTKRDVEIRAEEIAHPVNKPGTSRITILHYESAIRNDGTTFRDSAVHKYLIDHGVKREKQIEIINNKRRERPTEYFKCDLKTVRAAIIAIKERKEYDSVRDFNFKLRPEQQAAIEKTIAYYHQINQESPEKTPRFLWNAKMRFGKTFTAYELAKKMGFSRVLILTFKPAVQSAWKEDLERHIDFDGWQFVSRNYRTYEECDKNKPIVCFGSFQDYLGKNDLGGIKPKNEWVHTIDWDLIILDEYHYGAWRENAKDLFKNESKEEQKFAIGEGLDLFDEDILPIKTKYFLYLSGTPFRAIANGEFIEEQIYNWTYSDEQRAKENWVGDNNPYASLPKMVLLTYQLPESIRKIAMGGELNQFDLNLFFEAVGNGDNAKFKYEEYVQKWLDLIRGSYLPTIVDQLKLGSKKPPLPYSNATFRNILTHTVWFLPSVAACEAMQNLLAKRHNVFYHDYTVNLVAGPSAGIGLDALPPVRESMENPLESKTITLTCGKLTTGVTIKPWTGIFMLRNLTSPETYFQAAFRVQSPWEIYNPDGKSPNKMEIIKEECYVFDFAPDRALSQIADYSCRLNIEESNPEKKVEEFIHFLPVLAYDGSTLKEVSAADVLDIAMSGTSATLLAKRWESALLVNVDDDTLRRVRDNPEALAAIMKIEGFRNMNANVIETIINESEDLKKKKKDHQEKKDGETAEERKKIKHELSEQEKETKQLRTLVQEKLRKFATRIPIFMYLTDFREYCLKDIVMQLEPDLFQKVTGITIPDFQLLVSIGVFNAELMNDAVYKFKRYEDASLAYSGINKHQSEKSVGGFDTVISKDDYSNLSL